MLLSAIPPQTLNYYHYPLYSHNFSKLHFRPLSKSSAPNLGPTITTRLNASSVTNGNSNNGTLHHVSSSKESDVGGGGNDDVWVSSASAVAATIQKASTSPVEFVQRIEKDGKTKGLVLPRTDFLRLCVEQLDLFCRIIDSDALLSVNSQLVSIIIGV